MNLWKISTDQCMVTSTSSMVSRIDFFAFYRTSPLIFMRSAFSSSSLLWIGVWSYWLFENSTRASSSYDYISHEPSPLDSAWWDRLLFKADFCLIILSFWGCVFFAPSLVSWSCFSGSAVVGSSSLISSIFLTATMYCCMACSFYMPFLLFHASHLPLSRTFHMLGCGMFTSPVVPCL